jgi:large subunit ribosomal protein L22
MKREKALKNKIKRAIAREGCVSTATLSGIHVSPQKARLVVDMVRGKYVETAIEHLTACDKKTAPLLKKLLLSAVSNAKQSGVDVDSLFVKKIWVGAKGILKRSMPRAQGRATPILKRYSAITVELDEI